MVRTSVEVLHLYPWKLDLKEATAAAESASVWLRRLFPKGTQDISFTTVMIDDYNLTGRGSDDVVNSAMEVISSSAASCGIFADTVIRESSLVPSADQMLELLSPRLVDGTLVLKEPAVRTAPVVVQLWDEDPNGTRRWSCTALAAAWQLARLGLVDPPVFESGDASRFVGETSLSLLHPKFLHTENEVRSVLATIEDENLRERVLKSVQYLFVQP